MSRIHEALKKAAQERAAVTAADGGVPQADQLIIAPPERRNGTAPLAMDVSITQTAITGSPRGDYLRFDDLRTHCAHPRWNIDPNASVFFNPSLSAPGAEQFRTLRSRLYQLRGNRTLRTILVTSSVPGEGKTFVVSNLCQALVRQPDRRVLMIDADLRCSRLHVPLGAPATPGLTDYLSGAADEMSVIQHGHEGNLCLIPGGVNATNPSELLANGRLKMLLDRVAPIFDWVILDSPPCLPVADASVLADMCDGVLFVVRAAVTSSEVAQRACQEMKTKNVIGVVLNAVKDDPAYGSAYYYELNGKDE
jgi:capsular exopolysaccharide synthesis family protein